MHALRSRAIAAILLLCAGIGLPAITSASEPDPRRPRASGIAVPGDSAEAPSEVKPASTIVAVPQGDGAPVITDGIFSPGEWDDAKLVQLNGSVALYFKEYRDVVFIGVRGRENAGIGPSELFIAAPGGPVWKLHVSAQLFEALVTADDDAKAPRFGLTTDWYANEQRRDMPAADRLQKEGKDPIAIMRATSYPSDGIEFAIRRSKLPGDRWLTFLSASAIVEGRPGALVYPASASPGSTEGWLELRFE